MSVALILAVIKRITQYAKSTGQFTAHSLRISRATVAMKGGMSLTQIRMIGEWDSKAVMLYLKENNYRNKIGRIKNQAQRTKTENFRIVDTYHKRPNTDPLTKRPTKWRQ
ncbi:hypothetical protein C2G38_2151101 [Gigaspora rosea]|uniref:Tyr recombinase domain-containing protein n=1 Tax=Gigaspora rosea TaxID=44941 RepID=A0A397W988_9GLOM|nr:hypothetical protein C2G38_2151101 [Gigaspora rosea]